MPEGPEVDHSARKVHSLLAGWTLSQIILVGGPYLSNPKPKYSNFREKVSTLEPHLIKKVYAVGKQMIFELEGAQYAAMTAHFGMSGQWCLSPGDHHLLTIQARRKDGARRQLYFCDQRRFGTFGLLTSAELNRKIKKMGLQVLSPFTISELLHRLHKRPDAVLCDLLLDQKVFSGVGNYLRADIMYVAQLHPLRTIGSLTKKEERRLYLAIRDVCRESVEASATTCGNYDDPIHTGEYVCKVYGRDADDQGRAVEKFQRKKRAVHWCPDVQVFGSKN